MQFFCLSNAMRQVSEDFVLGFPSPEQWFCVDMFLQNRDALLLWHSHRQNSDSEPEAYFFPQFIAIWSIISRLHSSQALRGKWKSTQYLRSSIPYTGTSMTKQGTSLMSGLERIWFEKHAQTHPRRQMCDCFVNETLATSLNHQFAA